VLLHFSGYDRRHCTNIFYGLSSTQITTFQVQRAAQAKLTKLERDDRNLCSDLSSSALVSDPPNANGSFAASHLEEPICEILIVE
jgi:hypothetical protein